MQEEITASDTDGQAKQTRGLVSAATASVSKDRRRENEDMTSFLQKKKEMFLVQMSLDTKREEIRKLEAKAQLKEEALKKSELMLEEDAIRFDTFLKENDKKAHEAIKLAENETKFKADKVQEIKKLNQQIQLVQSDMSKLKEQLEDCLQYKKFLDDLTPPEYYDEQRAIKKERQTNRLLERKAKKMREWETKKARAIATAEKKDKMEREKMEKEGKNGKKKSEKPKAREVAVYPPMPNLDDMAAESSDEELPMYFGKPQQLLDMFTALEESNLFLIQNSQETEQALEELKQNFRETRNKMDLKTQVLSCSIDTLRSQITQENGKAGLLRDRLHGKSGEDKQQVILKKLHENVREVYKRCGYDADSNPSTLYMLTDLESRLEDLLRAMESMPEEVVLKAEKEKEKERRERVRTERMTTQQVQYEERMKKSMERSMQAPRKKKGRQVMTRSQPLRRAKQAEALLETDNDDQEDQQFLT